MLIISKYKDYYDYLSGVYGVDEKIVLDRRTADLHKEFCPDNVYFSLYQLALCGKMYFGAVSPQGNWYWNEKLLEIAKPDYKGRIIQNFSRWFSDEVGEYVAIEINENFRNSKENTPFKIKETGLNDKEKCPIVLYRKNRREYSVVALYPRLSDLGFPSQYEAQYVYLELVAWIGKQNDQSIENNMTDKEKIKAKGFDYKKSFRKMKR